MGRAELYAVDFFQRLWKFNAIVIAAAGVLAILGAVSLLMLMIAEWSRHARRADDQSYLQATPDNSTSFKPFLDEMDSHSSPPFIILKVGTGDKGAGSYNPYSLSDSVASETRNVLLIDRRDGSNRYILPDNRHAVLEWHRLPKEENAHAKAYVAFVNAEEAGAEPKQVDHPINILVGNFAAGRQAWVAKGVSAAEAPVLVDDHTLGILMWEGEKLFYRLINIDDFRVTRSSQIPLKAIERPQRSH